MSKYTSLVKNTLIFGVGNFTTKLIYFFLMPIYTVALSPYDFGIADLLNNSLQLILPILTLSIADAVFRFSLDNDVDPRELLASGFKVLGWSWLVVIVYLGVAIFLQLDEYWIVFGILYITESLKTLLAQFTRGLGKVKEYALNGIIAGIVLFGCSYLFLRKFNLGISGYLWAYVLANVGSAIYLLFAVGVWKYINIRISNKKLIMAMLAFSLPLTPNMLSWWLTNISSRYIIAGFCGLSLSGLFAAASKIPALINVISSIFQLSWQFASVKEHQDSDKSPFYSIVLKYFSILMIISGSIIIALMPFISLFVLKGDYYEAWRYTPLLLFSAILGSYSMFFGTFYAVVKQNKKALWTTLWGAVANVVICLATIPLWGVNGALAANVISYLLIVGLRIKDCQRFILIKIDWKLTVVSMILLLIESFIMMSHHDNLHFLAYAIPCILIVMYFPSIMNVNKMLINSIKNRR